ncbi:hypothetical protein BC829DRAFT_378530 [Chytridium lagenaria]|nr:hypothetical protein BC829DRAFT_378530 [Chytridium lagenaria]
MYLTTTLVKRTLRLAPNPFRSASALQTRQYHLPVNEVRKGLAVSHKGKDVLRAGKLTERFNANAVLEGVDLVDKPFQFLYTLEEHAMSLDALEATKDIVPLINDEMNIKVSFQGDKPIMIKLPTTGTFKVVYTDPPASTVTNEGKGTMFKSATLENDFLVTVPEFVQSGDTIVLDLVDGKYKERVLNKRK